MTYPLPNVNGGAGEIWEWISNFNPHFIGHVLTYPCWDLSLIHVSKTGPGKLGSLNWIWCWMFVFK